MLWGLLMKRSPVHQETSSKRIFYHSVHSALAQFLSQRKSKKKMNQVVKPNHTLSWVWALSCHSDASNSCLCYLWTGSSALNYLEFFKFVTNSTSYFHLYQLHFVSLFQAFPEGKWFADLQLNRNCSIIYDSDGPKCTFLIADNQTSPESSDFFPSSGSLNQSPRPGKMCTVLQY